MKINKSEKIRTSLEARIDQAAHAVIENLPKNKLSIFLIEFIVFGLKQAWASLFGGLLLFIILATSLIYPSDAILPRYDFLLIIALIIQFAMLYFKLETIDEAKVILLFHMTGTIMEIFKTYMGSWVYPEENILRIAGVPLFSGFMYAAVGSYIARVWRIFDLRFLNYPPIWITAIFASAIYINFFTHHFTWDMRWGLILCLFLIFGKSRFYFTIFRYRLWMPVILGFFLVALFIWVAENISTFSNIWLYPDQVQSWSMVSWGKLSSWLLLMIISVVMVTLVNKMEIEDLKQERPQRDNVSGFL